MKSNSKDKKTTDNNKNTQSLPNKQINTKSEQIKEIPIESAN